LAWQTSFFGTFRALLKVSLLRPPGFGGQAGVPPQADQVSGFSPAAGLKPAQSALEYPEIVTLCF
jgi:hypothetical protein